VVGSDRVFLSTARLGSVTRRKLFSLPPVVPAIEQTPSPAPSTARISHATLRKSFRKTLQTVSGFRVRMRTVFVPYVLLPEGGREGVGPGEEDDDERERREAGNDERTVVLCVEIENSAESGRRVGFAVEAVEVRIGGEGAKATLIGWEDRDTDFSKQRDRFPLLIGANEQYNLLYAVSFLRSPGDVDGFSLTSDDPRIWDRFTGVSDADLQRAVTINIFGKPFLLSETLPTSEAHTLVAGQNIDTATDSGVVSFPTQTFSSRWNCVLDLSSHQDRGDLADLIDTDGGNNNNNALPEPASPFPTFSPRTASALGINSAFPPFQLFSLQAVAGSRRHTIASPIIWSGRSSSTPTTSRPTTLSPPSRDRPYSTITSTTKYAPNVPHFPLTPTTYAPPHFVSPDDLDEDGYATPTDPYARPPPTPAYPAYPASTFSPPPRSLAPLASQAGTVGPSVEIRRARGAPMGGAVPVPQTPGPTVAGALGPGPRSGVSDIDGAASAGMGGRAIVVSIGLLPPAQGGNGGPMIFPLDRFTLDIFVFNQSARTRRFEVSCVYRRRGKGKGERGSVTPGSAGKKPAGLFSVGILPLDNRVRIG
jgi:hypothetical protein